jgi:hypothetical protein
VPCEASKAEAVRAPVEDVMIISEAIRQVIATGPLAHLTTLNADGSPQVAVVWVGSDGDECMSGHIRVQNCPDNHLKVHGRNR